MRYAKAFRQASSRRRFFAFLGTAQDFQLSRVIIFEMPYCLPAKIHVLLALYLAFTCYALARPYLNQMTAVPSGNVGTVNAIIPHCFIPSARQPFHPTNHADCKNALRNLVQQPGFQDQYRFSRNPRRGIQVPRGWRAGSCVIMLSCENDFDADVFSYKDVLKKAKFLVDQCIERIEGEGDVPFGGVDKIGSVGSFYVSLHGHAENPQRAQFLELTNVTLDARSDKLFGRG